MPGIGGLSLRGWTNQIPSQSWLSMDGRVGDSVMWENQRLLLFYTCFLSPTTPMVVFLVPKRLGSAIFSSWPLTHI